MEEWSLDQVCAWVRVKGLKIEQSKLRSNQVCGALLADMDNEMLEELGVEKKLHRRRILIDVEKYLAKSATSQTSQGDGTVATQSQSDTSNHNQASEGNVQLQAKIKSMEKQFAEKEKSMEKQFAEQKIFMAQMMQSVTAAHQQPLNVTVMASPQVQHMAPQTPGSHVQPPQMHPPPGRVPNQLHQQHVAATAQQTFVPPSLALAATTQCADEDLKLPSNFGNDQWWEQRPEAAGNCGGAAKPSFGGPTSFGAPPKPSFGAPTSFGAPPICRPQPPDHNDDDEGDENDDGQGSAGRFSGEEDGDAYSTSFGSTAERTAMLIQEAKVMRKKADDAQTPVDALVASTVALVRDALQAATATTVALESRDAGAGGWCGVLATVSLRAPSEADACYLNLCFVIASRAVHPG